MYVLGVLRKSIYEDDIQPKIQVPPSTGFETPHGFERSMSWDLKGIVCNDSRPIYCKLQIKPVVIRLAIWYYYYYTVIFRQRLHVYIIVNVNTPCNALNA